MKFKLTNECGQKWYRLSSWKACGTRGRVLQNNVGVAFGPVMFFWRYE